MSHVNENYHRVGSSIWREFRTDDTRIMAAYLLTCQHRTTEGLFVFPLGYIPADLGWKDARARKAFADVADVGMVRYDVAREVCLIVNALKWQSPANPNQRRAAMKRLIGVPVTNLDHDFYQAARLYAEEFANQLADEMPQRFATGCVNGFEPVEGLLR